MLYQLVREVANILAAISASKRSSQYTGLLNQQVREVAICTEIRDLIVREVANIMGCYEGSDTLKKVYVISKSEDFSYDFIEF